MDNEVEVAAIVVTWNSGSVIGGLLDSLPDAMDGLSWSAVIADNASSDETLEIARDAAPEGTVVQLGKNAGYAAGINAALRSRTPRRRSSS